MNFKVEYVYELVNKISPAIKKIKADNEGMRVKILSALSAISKWLTKVTKKFSVLGTVVKRVIGSSLGSPFGRLTTAFLGTAALAKGIQVIASFGKSMSFLKGQLSDTNQNIDKFRTKIREIGRTTRFSAQEVADAVTGIVKSGVTNYDEVFGILKGGINLSLLEQRDDLANVAEDIIKIKKTYEAFGQTISVDRIVNVLGTTFGKTTLNLQRFEGSLKNILAVAGKAKIPFEELVASLGIISNKSVYKGTAGTTLKMFMNRIPKIGASKLDSKLGQAYTSLGLDYNKLSFSRQQKVYGNVSLVRTLEEIMSKLKKTNDPETFLNTIFGDRGSKLVTYVDLKNFKELIEANKKGIDVQSKINIITNNLSEDFKALSSTMADLAIETGDKGLTAGLRGLTKDLTTFIRAIISGDFSKLSSSGAGYAKAITVFVNEIPKLINAVFGGGSRKGLGEISKSILLLIDALKEIAKAIVTIAGGINRLINWWGGGQEAPSERKYLIDYVKEFFSPAKATEAQKKSSQVKTEDLLSKMENSIKIKIENNSESRVTSEVNGVPAFNTGANTARQSGFNPLFGG